MINNNETKNQNHLKLKIEEYDSNNEKNLYKEELKKNYSKEDIEQYFELITETKIIGWENKLFESKISVHDFENVADPDIINEVSNDKKITRLIKNDIERTRVKESIYMPNFNDYVYQLLIYYINKNDVIYKQGLNEVLGPFILLKYKLKISLSRIYKLFVSFVDKFSTNYFHESDFYSLRSSLSLINLLLRYHEPELFHKFEHRLISPDLYATCWLMTLFANKCSLNVTYYLWDKLILFDDNLFPHYFIVALLIINKEKYIGKGNDFSTILSILSDLHIDTIEEVNKIINLATEIGDKTPNSLYLLSNRLEIFNFNSNNLKNLYEQYNPDKMFALPIFPNELFCIIYQDLFSCPYEKCKNFLKTKNFDLSNCIYCRNNELKKNIKNIIFDIRIFEDDSNWKVSEEFPGYLPCTLRITNQELRKPNFSSNLINKYNTEKDNYHFIILTSETDNFQKFEKQFYKVKGRRNSKVGVNYKGYKEIDINKVKEVFNKRGASKKEYLLLKEFDNFKKLIDEMNKQEFKYVSYVYGGYKEVHLNAMKYKIDLIEHGKKCFLCKEQNFNSSFFKFW